MPASNRDHVFISYSHKDKRWLDDLLVNLRPFLRANSVTAWSDRQIQPGSNWFDEIQNELSRARVAVLLVTPNFLASDFIHEHELTPLLRDAENGGLTILWVPVRSSAYQKSPIKNYQSVIDPNKPLAEMKAERDAAWVRICEAIERAAATGENEPSNC
jgi:internalin A